MEKKLKKNWEKIQEKLEKNLPKNNPTQTLFNSKINASYNIRIVICLVQIGHNYRIIVKLLVTNQCSRQWFLFFHLWSTVRRAAIQLNIIRFGFIVLRSLLSAPLQCEETSQFLAPINALDDVNQDQLYNTIKKFEKLKKCFKRITFFFKFVETERNFQIPQSIKLT